MLENEIAQCLGAFYTAHRQELFTYALSITHSPACAEDAIHDAFGRVLQKGRLPAELRPYVFRCVRNASLDVLRSVKRERQLDGYQLIFHDNCDLALRETAAELLALLSDREREIVVLKIFSGLTLKEIAQVCGARQGTVATIYWRSLQSLRKQARKTLNGDASLGEQTL